MSYEIYYDRKFLKVGDKFIPLFQHGSNNAYEIKWNGREIPEKVWNVQNYKKKGHYIFSEQEIRELGEIYSTCEMNKSRNRHYTPDEIKRLFVNGMKSAQPLEYYLSLGNTFYVQDWTDWENQKTYPISSTEELVVILSQLTGRSLKLSFGERNLHLPKTYRPKRSKEKVDQYFILKLTDRVELDDVVLFTLTRFGYRYTIYETLGKKFRNEKEATRYVTKYNDRLSGFVPILINRECYL